MNWEEYGLVSCEGCEGCVAFFRGTFLHDNPYDSCCDDRYYAWYDGWNQMCKLYPHLEPIDD